jgi:predicted ester cyclase
MNKSRWFCYRFIFCCLMIYLSFLRAQVTSNNSSLSPTEANKALVRTFIEEAWNRGRMELCDSLLSSTSIGHMRGHEFSFDSSHAKEILTHWRNGLSGFKFKIEAIMAEGDLVTIHVPFEGTHTGNLIGIPATNRKVFVDEILIVRLREGKLVEFWEIFDEHDMRRQLGVTLPVSASGKIQ